MSYLTATKKWSCTKKQQARFETIINPYRTLFGKSVPSCRQYWTLSGRCADDDGNLNESSELGQLLDSGLIRPQQFHSVERNRVIHEANLRCHTGANWHYGDFYSTMSHHKPFDPAIVNADFLDMPKKAAPYFSNILAFLTHTVEDGVMLIGNFVLRARHLEVDHNEILTELENCSRFLRHVEIGKWSVWGDQAYIYRGTGRTSTVMGTVVFVKSKEALG